MEATRAENPPSTAIVNLAKMKERPTREHWTERPRIQDSCSSKAEGMVNGYKLLAHAVWKDMYVNATNSDSLVL